MKFREDFIWGTATSAYQIEGNVSADGKGESIWDVWTRQRQNVRSGHNGDVACDHYNRYREDIQIMKKIGLKAYRFSISWTRVMPEGIGRVNPKGLEFYNRLVDELLKNDITPYITLFHWDYPEALMNKGGWLNRESAEWFGEYAGIVTRSLSDRVEHWITINEPQCFAKLGYEEGIHAPGMRVGKRGVFAAAHNLLRAHGKAVQSIRAYSRSKSEIGFAPALNYIMPDSSSPEDIRKAKERMFSCCREDGIWCTPWWTEPVYHGRYPEDGMDAFREWIPEIKEGDMELICQPLDFFGFNYYHASRYSGKTDPGYAENAVGWPVEPEGLYYMLKFLYERYLMPILITENGMANLDWPARDGKIRDYQRIDYIERHLCHIFRAIQDGIDIRGYFYWSLLDNFEWNEGYQKRFGLIYVDYKSQQRIWKESAYWYKKMIETRGECL